MYHWLKLIYVNSNFVLFAFSTYNILRTVWTKQTYYQNYTVDILSCYTDIYQSQIKFLLHVCNNKNGFKIAKNVM